MKKNHYDKIKCDQIGNGNTLKVHYLETYVLVCKSIKVINNSN